MKRVFISVAVVLGLGLTQARAQDEQAAVETKQGVIGKIIDDLKESTRTVHEINKESLSTEKAAYRVRHAEATEPNEGFVKFREASGFKGKMQVLSENFKESCRENSEKAKENRAQIKSHESYRATINRGRQG